MPAVQVCARLTLLGCLSLYDVWVQADPIPRRQTAVAPSTPQTTIQPSFRPVLTPADGVTDLTLGDLIRRPMGPCGIEVSDRARALAGKPVRVCGYVANQTPPVPWKVLLSPIPVALHDLEFGLCDDLPATAIRVELPRLLPPVLPPLRYLVAMTGVLELDGKEGADGRSIPLRLVVTAELYQSFPPMSVTNFARASTFATGPTPTASQQ